MKSARQVSRIKVNDNYEEFSLGRFYPPKRSISIDKDLNYLSTKLFDGSYCNLVSSARSSRIRFICANSKQTMHLTNVMETSACSYDFLVHVPELCNYLPIHAKIEKHISKIKCFEYSESKSQNIRQNEGSKSAPKKNDFVDGLDQMLGLIESKYKDSKLLIQHKNLLIKASEKLKSQQLAKEISWKRGAEVSLADLLVKMIKPDTDITTEEIDEDHESNVNIEV